MNVPKTIHQIWVGPNDPPYHWLDGWKLPGWEYRLWRESDLDELNMTKRWLYDRYYSDRCWYGCADVARAEILGRHGGVYVDADVEMIRPFDGAPWLNSEVFAVLGANRKQITNSLMGCVPSAPAMLEYVRRMGTEMRWHPQRKRRYYPVWIKVGSGLLAKVAQEFEITVVPPGAWFPFDRYGNALPVEGITYGRHIWASTTGVFENG